MFTGPPIGGGVGKFAPIMVEAISGANLGNEVSKSLDHADLPALKHSTPATVDNNFTGAASTWHHPNSGREGTVK